MSSETTTVTNPNNLNQSITSSDDNFRLDSPYLHRLIHHLRHPNATSSQLPRHSPTSKSAIESLPTLIVTTSFLQTDPVVLCPVCKDQFVVNDETKQLPCKHVYHTDCIIPWLSQRNSCPVCRFQLPKEPGHSVRIRRRFRTRGVEVVVGDDEVMLGVGFSHVGETSEVDVGSVSLERENAFVVGTEWPDFSLSRRRGHYGWLDGSDDDDVELL